MTSQSVQQSPGWSPEPARVDMADTSARLQAWLRDKRPDAPGLTIHDLTVPTLNGGTGDNVILSYTPRPGAAPEKVVVRLGPTGDSHIFEVSIVTHFRVLQALHTTAVPSPTPLWLESDPAVLGVPFMVMDYVPGRAPSDFPIYNSAGFLFDAPVEYRHRLWESALGALVAVHALDPEPFVFLDRPERGPDGLRQHLAYLHGAYETSPLFAPIAPLAAALEWLDRTAPATPRTGVSWGDPRIGNMLFACDTGVRALLDWDQAGIAGPLADLGWWLMFDRLHDEDYGARRLEGLGSRTETLETWERLTGYSSAGIDWYEILAAVRLVIVRLRGQKARERDGAWVPGPENARSWQRLMARVDTMIERF
ncbi:MAG: phosphotransferase family protein [Sciscionella sp.]